MTKEITLSEKGFELDPNSMNYNTAYYKEDVKQFIKEVLSKIRNLPSSKEASELYIWIKEKAGKELVE